MKNKVCTKCKKSKPISHYHKMRDGLRLSCKSCRNEYLKKWSKDQKQLRRAQKYRHRYGITLETYNALLEDQNNCCAICNSKTPKRNLEDTEA